jgi:hypothetical protein
MVLYGPFAVTVALTFSASEDDPFITLRYAYNLLHGRGLVFNPGQHVNGATSPVGVAMAVVALVLPGGYTFLKLKLLSLLFGVLTLGRVRRLLETLAVPRWALIGGLLLLGSNGPIGFASGSGLETTVDSFAIAALLVELCTQSAFDRPLRAGILAALAVASRPEAALVVGLAGGGCILLARGRTWKVRVRWLWGPVIAETLIVAGNQLYYGRPLPNTYYAKHVPLSTALAQGRTYLSQAVWPPLRTGLVSDPLAHDAATVAVGLLVIGLATAMLHPKRYGGVVLVLVAQCMFVVLSGGDWMRGDRFYEPAAAMTVVLQVLGAVSVGRAVRQVIRPEMLGIAGLATALVASLYSFVPTSGRTPITALGRGVSDSSLLAEGNDEYGLGGAWAALPAVLACVHPGDLVATTEAGYVAYADPDVRFLDLRGLTSSAVVDAAPRGDRNDTGVVDQQWWQVSDAVGRLIVQYRPVLILTVDRAPRTIVLDGEYRAAEQLAGGSLPLVVYTRRDISCPTPNTLGSLVRAPWAADSTSPPVYAPSRGG